ncbi:hypothetical protein V8B97DRAFT_1048147 [Scleroderma yunnanense]
MGPTGSGKSTFIKKATGIHESIIGHDLISRTSEVRAVKYTDGEDSEGAPSLVLVDTPGLNNNMQSDSEIFTMITEWLGNMGLSITGILYFHRISDNRITGVPTRDLIVFKDICGGFGQVLMKTILTTTMWDEVNDEVAQERLAELQSSPIWKAMHAYKGDRDSAKQLIHEVIRRQRETQQGLPAHEVPGREGSKQHLLSDMEKLAERQLEILRKINAEKGLSTNTDSHSELEVEFEELRHKMEELWRQIHSSSRSLWTRIKGYLSGLRDRLFRRT